MNASLTTTLLLAPALLLSGLAVAQSPIGTRLDGPGSARFDDDRATIDLLPILVGADGRVTIRAERLGEATHALLVVSATPRILRLDSPRIDVLQDGFVADWLPVTGGDCTWQGPDIARLGDSTIWVQILAVDGPTGARFSDVLMLRRPRDYGNPLAGHHQDCDDTITYDGPSVKIDLYDPRYAVPMRVVSLDFLAPTAGYALEHYGSVESECGEDVYVTFDQPFEPVLQVETEVHTEVVLGSHQGNVRVFLGLLRQDGDVLFWDFALAEVLAN